jgi:light-regulated signal transduction histidine kinase (bacteriophytochrome)
MGPSALTVDNCEREPIHTPNLIQPSGSLIAFEPATGQVLHASANLGRWFPSAADGAVGRPLAQVVGDDAQARLLQTMALAPGTTGRHRAFELPAPQGAGPWVGLQGLLHRHQGLCIAELEPAAAPATDHAWQPSFRASIEALSHATELDDLVQRMADRVRQLIGFHTRPSSSQLKHRSGQVQDPRGQPCAGAASQAAYRRVSAAQSQRRVRAL